METLTAGGQQLPGFRMVGLGSDDPAAQLLGLAQFATHTAGIGLGELIANEWHNELPG
jgi:hypothetical protein